MEEAYLHFIWRHQYFDKTHLSTSDGIQLAIETAGNSNPNSGPDFLQAKVRMGNLEIAGHIEIHIKSSDWYRHGHENDAAYNPVVLHVVYENDAEAQREDGSLIPQLELKSRLDEMPLWKYYQWIQDQQWIPCAQEVRNWDRQKAAWWLTRLTAERMELKWNRVRNEMKAGKELEQISWEILARAFGGTVNREAFQSLAERIGWKKILQLSQRSTLELEAVLFGVSGLIPDEIDSFYLRELKTTWVKYQSMWNLESMNGVEWRFSRMRPAGFPTIRIAQLCQLLFDKKPLSFTSMDFRILDSSVSDYWKDHYHFGKRFSKSQSGKFSPKFNIHLRINAEVLIAQAVFYSSISEQNEHLDVLEELPPEDNSVVRGFRQLGFSASNALETQGLKHLKENYCEIKACWSCSIGQHLLTSYFGNEKTHGTVPSVDGKARI